MPRRAEGLLVQILEVALADPEGSFTPQEGLLVQLSRIPNLVRVRCCFNAPQGRRPSCTNSPEVALADP